MESGSIKERLIQPYPANAARPIKEIMANYETDQTKRW